MNFAAEGYKESGDLTDNPAYGVFTSEPAVDRLESEYNMENNPLYMINNMRSPRTLTADIAS